MQTYLYSNKRVTIRRSRVFGWIIWTAHGWAPLDASPGLFSLQQIRKNLDDKVFPQDAKDYVDGLILGLQQNKPE